MKKALAALATVVVSAVVHDVVQIRKETGMPVTESVRELVDRTKRGFVSGFWKRYLLSR